MKKIFFFLLAIGFSISLNAQRIALKNNLIGNATLSPNLALEFGVGKRTTLELYGSYNPFSFNDNKKFKHWLAQPEFRYWSCERFNGTFFGIHAFGGEFNVAGISPFNMMKFLKENRYEGYIVGGGLTFGHQWILGKRWSLEAAIGAGYAYLDYDRYAAHKCGAYKDSDSYNYWGITRTVLSFAYFFR